MNDELMCARVRSALSARLDDEATEFPVATLESHVAGCSGCRSFETSQHALRRMLRLTEVEDVPDVAPAVMHRLRDESSSAIWRFRLRLASVAAVAAALVVLAATLPVLERTPDIANAQVVTRRAFTAAASLESYSARFDVVERGWHPDVPTRRFEAEVWYQAPERFRLQIRDLTNYPEGGWPRNDVDLIAEPSRMWISEPFSCPPAALPGCAISAGVEERTLIRRQPFDGSSVVPTDIVVPLESLATSDAVTVVDEVRVGDRDAVHLRLSYRQAFPLINALQPGGSWARLFPLDRVDLWLDRTNWFPLRFAVTRPGGNRPLLEVSATNVKTSGTLPRTIFDAPVGGSVRDGGFIPDRSADAIGPVPGYVADLPLYRSGQTSDGRNLVAFARGMTYLKVTTGRRGSSPDLSAAEVVDLGNGSVGLYRPAEAGGPRRLDVFGARTHVRIETNLRRDQAIRVAASLPIVGSIPEPEGAEGATSPVTVSELNEIPFVLRPSSLPPGYGSLRASLVRSKRGDEVTILFLPAESGLEGSEIRLFQSTRVEMLPPSSEDLVATTVAGASARWSQERGELEWIGEDGVYRAITAPSFDLETARGIAESLR